MLEISNSYIIKLVLGCGVLKNKNKIYIILYCFFVSLIILLFTTKNSPFYAFNDWADANAFFTVGKSMMHGLIPYKDIFEQKGPFLYLLYGIGYLISHRSFIGVFLIELIVFTIGLYYLYKTLKMFLSTKSTLLILPIFIALLTTSRAFTHGGSAEEFCFGFFFITLYYFFKHFKVQELTFKEMLINGIVAGLVLLTKYTLLGFWIGFTFSIFIYYLLKKNLKKAIIYPLTLLFGMFIPFISFSFYFLINHGFAEFFHNYFTINITTYSVEKIKIWERIKELFNGFYSSLYTNPVMFYLIILTPLLIWKLKLSNKAKILYIIIIIMTILGVFCGLKFYRYYILFILYFSSISLLLIFNLFDISFNKINKYLYLGIITFTIILSCIYSYKYANYKSALFKPKSSYYQFEYAKILNNYENATLVNMGFLDCGLFTASGIVPSTYFFQKHNFDYKYFPLNQDSFDKYIKEKKTTHIVYVTKWSEVLLKEKEKLLFENYRLIGTNKQKYEERKYNIYLFEIKNTP